jgi:hypothetical protein
MGLFDDACLKIQRANKHICDVRRRVLDLENSYTAVIEVNASDGSVIIKYDLLDKDAIRDIAILIGDTLHNLKSALDYGWMDVLNRHAPEAKGSKTQFPIRFSKKNLDTSLKGNKIDTLCPRLFDLVITEIRSYDGGNEALWTVKELNNSDKHRLLLPLIGHVSIVGLEMENDGGEPIKGPGRATWKSPPWYVSVRDGWRVKEKGRPSFRVLFGDGQPSQHRDVLLQLQICSNEVLKVVNSLNAFS